MPSADVAAQTKPKKVPTTEKPLTSFGELSARAGALGKVKQAEVINNSFEYRKSKATASDSEDEDCVVSPNTIQLFQSSFR